MDGHNAGPSVATDADQPVFVDKTGQRRRLTMLVGLSIAVGMLVSLGLIVAGLFGGSPVPLPIWSDTNVQEREGQDPLDIVIPIPTPGSPTTGTKATPPPPPDRTEPSTTQPPATQTAPGRSEPTHTTPGRRPSKSPGKPK